MHGMRFAAAALLASNVCAQGTSGPIWSPPGGNAGNSFCSGVSGPTSEPLFVLSSHAAAQAAA